MALFVASLVQAQQVTSVKSFKDWKTEMIEEAKARLEKSKAALENHKKNLAAKKELLAANSAGKPEAVSDTQTERWNNQIQSDESYLTLTQFFTVTDYFVGYLIKQKDSQTTFKDAAAKLSADEVAELLTAYANHINESNTVKAKPKTGKSASDQLGF